MPALPDHTKQICRTPTGGCMCDPEYSICERLRKYREAPASAPAPVPQYERGDLP